jgi:16S rRNA (adenine1518-N6/adenine1519-N6)-dimethyltransferase
MKAKKSLGQHFLTSTGIARRIVKAGMVQNGDTVLEIGPGKGILTRALLDQGARVIAIETELYHCLKTPFPAKYKMVV